MLYEIHKENIFLISQRNSQEASTEQSPFDSRSIRQRAVSLSIFSLPFHLFTYLTTISLLFLLLNPQSDLGKAIATTRFYWNFIEITIEI